MEFEFREVSLDLLFQLQRNSYRTFQQYLHFLYCSRTVTQEIRFSSSIVVDVYNFLNVFPSFQHIVSVVIERINIVVNYTCPNYLVQYIPSGGIHYVLSVLICFCFLKMLFAFFIDVILKMLFAQMLFCSPALF